MPPDFQRPKRSLGQNFLVDRRVLGQILQAADVTPDDIVVEVGPGRGILTRQLARSAGRLLAVEIDDALASNLTHEFSDQSQVEIINADVREIDMRALIDQDAPYKLVANLPYNAGSAIVRWFLQLEHPPVSMVVMLQREVAKNMAAPPGDMGYLSVFIQLYGKPKIVTHVPPKAFRPAPKVTSSIIRIEVYESPRFGVGDAERFLHLARAGFSAPRKQIHNCLKHGLTLPAESVADLLRDAEIDPKRRAETLSMDEWYAMYQSYRIVEPMLA